MSTLNARKFSPGMIVVSAFWVLACVSIELLLATALWVSAINNSGLVILVALCSVPLTALFCLAVKVLDTRLSEYQDSYTRLGCSSELPQSNALMGIIESGKQEGIKATLSW